MKYMILECHPGYAVALDEEGKFLKVANCHYEVGQMVTEVVPMQAPPRKKIGKWAATLVSMAACLALVLGLTLPRGIHQPYASVYVKINPEVRIDVDKNDRVVGLEGVNEDGIALIAEYDHQNQHLDIVTDELVDRAIDMGYLQPDGQITISLDSQDQLWVENHSQSISSQLQTHLQERIVVNIEIKLCTHVHPGQAHGRYEDYFLEEEDIYLDPENPDRIVIELDLDDTDDRHEENDDHDDHDEDDEDDHDEDDDDDDHDDDD